ncbi:hypothetical protein HZA55_04565 [Candidatus Poribacteria bacterium]|nr:hypothetical protein [Candidatus Poribacteria bacterium]
MHVYKNEFEQLAYIKSFVEINFQHFGANKRQEITRLTYEISKSENISSDKVFNELLTEDTPVENYTKIKKKLLERRYRYAVSHNEPINTYLPKIDLFPNEFVNLTKQRFYPKKVFIETGAINSSLAKQFKTLFPESNFIEIASLKEYLHAHKEHTVEDYNNRRNMFFIVNENYDFFKCCPCTSGAYGCGYHIFNFGFGCIYECTYCYLQHYTNNPGIILPANIDRFFDNFNKYKKPRMRIGTGEFSDSLAFDNITNFSVIIADFFRKQKDVIFEFKTKSCEISNLLKIESAPNIVIAWSLNPQRIINENEFFSTTLEARLQAAKESIDAGYKVAFHFDPVIYFHGWEDEYEALIDLLFEKINSESIAWISIGTFRFSPGLKPIIERRFPQNKILDEELLIGYDNKLRYSYSNRCNIYKKILIMLHKHSKNLKIYLCMEEISMWKDLDLKMPDLLIN